MVHTFVNFASMREIKFYTTQSGKSPIANFLDSLNSKQAKKVTWVLNLVEQKDRGPENISKSYPAHPVFGKFGFSPDQIFSGFLVLLMMANL